MQQTSSTHPTLILIRGLPGSGKSYLAHALADHLGRDKTVLLDPDATDYDSSAYTQMVATLRAEGVDEKFYPYRFLRGQAHQAINEGKYIIWNQAFTNLDGFQKTITNLQTYATEHGTKLPTLVVEVTIDEATARARVADRAAGGNHDVSDEEFQRFMRDYTSFKDEGFHLLEIDGTQDVTQSVQAIVSKLTR